MKERTYKPVGKCIYCGSVTDLSDEHIIAFAIGGTDVLPKASCGKCRDLTSALEAHCFKNGIRPYRSLVGLHGRKKKDMPSKFPLLIQYHGGTVERPTLDIGMYPALLVMPKFNQQPGILEGLSPNPDAKIEAWGQLANSDTVAKNFRGSRVYLAPFHPGKWCRMLAKIAHAHAIAERGIYAFKPLVAGLIAGDDNAPTHYIGSFRHNLPAEPEYLHRIQLVECINDKVPNTKFLVAVIRLFANSGAPECCVVVGNL